MSNPGIVGGARPGAGRPKGSKNADTIEREAALRLYRERVSRQTDKLLDKQLSLAEGCQYLYVIRTVDKKKQKAELVKDPETIRLYLEGALNQSGDEEWYYITTERPDNLAINSMMDRTYGKPQQSIDHTTLGKKLPTPIYGGKSGETV